MISSLKTVNHKRFHKIQFILFDLRKAFELYMYNLIAISNNTDCISIDCIYTGLFHILYPVIIKISLQSTEYLRRGILYLCGFSTRYLAFTSWVQIIMQYIECNIWKSLKRKKYLIFFRLFFSLLCLSLKEFIPSAPPTERI